MIKNYLLTVGLLSLVLAGGCAKGGNGIFPTVAVSPVNVIANQIYPGQTVTLSATTTNPPYAAVTWSVSGMGTITSTTPPDAGSKISATATYLAQTTVGSQGTVTAALASNTSVTANAILTVVDVTTQVAPLTPNVGPNLTQQFAAVAVPDDAPQTFTWTCTANNVQCANFKQDPNISGLAYYTAQDNCSGNCVQITAASTLDPGGCSPNPKFCTIGKASLVASRVSGTYAFRFSGYDASNHATAVVGTFTAANGAITSGLEDELTASGWTQHSISGGSYTPTASDPNNSNNGGTLTLTTGAFPDKFQVVLDGAGDLEMIESDGQGAGSGIAQISAGSGAFKGDQTFAFGFTGVDSSGKRVGYAGVFPMDGSGNIVGGQMDVNDNGSSSNSVCSAPPCAVAGTYAANADGFYQLALTSPVAMTFDFYIASGSANKASPLTFYAISTDPGSNPAVSGTIVLQDSSQTYNIAAFNGTSVSALTGVNGANTNVSLTQGVTDGNGDFVGNFDQNNAGTIVTVPASVSAVEFTYTYAASATNGRYTFQMLGNPDASPVVPPLPFILYASGQNRGFLLDQSSPSVMTGTMSPQGKGSGSFSSSELTGTYGAATTSSGTSGVGPIAANLLTTLLTPPSGAETFNISGTQYPGGQTLAGAFNLEVASRENGTGTIALTAPATQNYVIYVVDSAGACSDSSPVCAIQDFFMIDLDTSNPNPSIIFAKQ